MTTKVTVERASHDVRVTTVSRYSATNMETTYTHSTLLKVGAEPFCVAISQDVTLTVEEVPTEPAA